MKLIVGERSLQYQGLEVVSMNNRPEKKIICLAAATWILAALMVTAPAAAADTPGYDSVNVRPAPLVAADVSAAPVAAVAASPSGAPSNNLNIGVYDEGGSNYGGMCRMLGSVPIGGLNRDLYMVLKNAGAAAGQNNQATAGIAFDVTDEHGQLYAGLCRGKLDAASAAAVSDTFGLSDAQTCLASNQFTQVFVNGNEFAPVTLVGPSLDTAAKPSDKESESPSPEELLKILRETGASPTAKLRPRSNRILDILAVTWDDKGASFWEKISGPAGRVGLGWLARSISPEVATVMMMGLKKAELPPQVLRDFQVGSGVVGVGDTAQAARMLRTFQQQTRTGYLQNGGQVLYPNSTMRAGTATNNGGIFGRLRSGSYRLSTP